jgi:hypothetical protein
MPHGSAPLTAQLHKALAVSLRYVGVAYLHSARRSPWLHRPTALAGSRSGAHVAWGRAQWAAVLDRSR